MRYRIFTLLSAIFAVVLTATALLSPSSVVALLLLAAALLLCLALGYRAVCRPLDAIGNGMNLLRSQDFGSRLRHTGQPDADNVIDLFNRLMDTMKTERLKLKEQNLFLSKLIEVSPLGIAVCDFDDNVVQANPVYRKLHTPELDAELASLRPEESRVVRLASSQIYRCSRLWFMDSGFRRTFYIIEVLTDDFIASERNVFNSIVRTIGHEVGNTLGPVNSVLDTLAEMHSGDRVVTSAIRSTRTACNNLLDFVRGYSGIVKLPAPHPVPTDLGDELRRMMPALRALAGEGIAVELAVDDAQPPLRLDMMLIERAIVNIVKNAAESIGDTPGGKIDITLAADTLAIADNGRGLSDAAMRSIFTPFFSTKRPDRGLGMMLISDILRAHSATFALTPSTPGATFTIHFPHPTKIGGKP